MIMRSDIWMANGIRINGPLERCGMIRWQFICPICGKVQCGEDFRQFKSFGAKPANAFRMCLGRYNKQLGCGYNSLEGDMFCPHVVDWGGGLRYGVFDFYKRGAGIWETNPIRN